MTASDATSAQPCLLPGERLEEVSQPGNSCHLCGAAALLPPLGLSQLFCVPAVGRALRAVGGPQPLPSWSSRGWRGGEPQAEDGAGPLPALSGDGLRVLPGSRGPALWLLSGRTVECFAHRQRCGLHV